MTSQSSFNFDAPVETKAIVRDPPFQRHSETSEAAAKKIKPCRSKFHRAIFDHLSLIGRATDEQIIDATGISPSTARPRRIELVQAGIVRDSSARRFTRSGSPAVLWELVPGKELPVSFKSTEGRD